MEIWNSLRIKFTHYARVYKMFPLRDSEFENEDLKIYKNIRKNRKPEVS